MECISNAFRENSIWSSPSGMIRSGIGSHEKAKKSIQKFIRTDCISPDSSQDSLSIYVPSIAKTSTMDISGSENQDKKIFEFTIAYLLDL